MSITCGTSVGYAETARYLSRTPSTAPSDGMRVDCSWTKLTAVELVNIDAFTFSKAYAINDAGTIAGTFG